MSVRTADCGGLVCVDGKEAFIIFQLVRLLNGSGY
jgi:hypothetical protein